MMKRRYLGSTLLARHPVAFQNYMVPARPGQVNFGLVQSLITAALIAADQGNEPSTTELQLGERDSDSNWMLDYWDLADDIVEGYKAIKARGTRYLPKFADEQQMDYDTRLHHTKFTNVFRDIIESLAAKPFEEEITLVVEKDATTHEEKPLPDNIAEFGEDVDGAGNNLTSFAATTFFNGIGSAIDWIYVDYPKVDATIIKTQADMKASGIRPFWSHVLGRNVLSAKSQVINGKETLVYMRILEPGTPNHIRLFERADDGTITFGLFEEKISADGKKKTYILIDNGVITIGVIPLVPFITGRRDGRTFKFFPPMRDAADLQIELYQQESGLKFAKTMTAYPMLAANGMNPDVDATGAPKRLAVGPNKVLWSKRDGAGNFGTWSYVSPDAACLTFLKEDIKETMDQLRELGRQPLTAQSGNLTVITTAFAAGKSRTAVGAWALRLQNALENAMLLTCLWLGIKDSDYEPEIEIFDDFDDFTTDQASDLSALQFARTNKDLSHKNYLRELKRRNTLRPDLDDDENAAQLLEEVPNLDDTAPDDGATASLKPGDPGYVASPPKPKPGASPPKPKGKGKKK